ncbi:hypothetical protein [Robbsia andropogonis]|uniref:hypothetical protein n=1 Tax=Robbsia andropogonis TaxID=28092 RepID=UPI002A699C76|nr:hypothetical protein [Robbsia andropogonis]
MKKTHTALLGALLLCACEQRTPAVFQQPAVATVQPSASVAGAPVIVQQPSNDGFFTGMLMGHLMSGGGGNGYNSNRTVVNKTVVNKTYVAPRQLYSAPRSYSSYSRSSSFGSFRSRR